VTADLPAATGSLADLTPVVLAGGDGERFGDRTKATATFEGQPMVVRVVEALRRATGRPPVLAVGDPAKRTVLAPLFDDVRYTYDADWCVGPLAGLAGALNVVRTDAIVLCGCDMPLVDPAAVGWLAARYRARAADAVVLVDEGAPQVLHGVYRRDAVARYCRDRPADPRLRELVDAINTTSVPTTAAPDGVPLAQSLTNVNTHAELAELRRTGTNVRRPSR
jgi:molybdopterin-guanine dinucleotide biosynthesis protein A